MSTPPEHIVILGDDVSAWMSAAFFAKLYASTSKNSKNKTKITLVASKKASIKNTIYSVQPQFLEYLDFMMLDESVFVKFCKATFKLADHYTGWSAPGSKFFHSYSQYGAGKGALKFHQIFFSLAKELEALDYELYSLGAEAAKSNRFHHSAFCNNSATTNTSYSLHFNSHEFIELLIDFCRASYVNVIQGDFSINQNHETNNIDSVEIRFEQKIQHLTADLYINCTANKQAVVERTDKIEWDTQIPTNLTLRIIQKGRLRNTLYDMVSARDFGYKTLTPSRSNIEVKLYSAKEFVTEEHTSNILKQYNCSEFEQTISNNFRLKSFWEGNVISIGETGVKLTSHSISEIDLTWVALRHIIKYTPTKSESAEIRKEFNIVLSKDLDNIKDFIRLQFQTSNNNSEYWKHCKNSAISDVLKHKLQLFNLRGKFADYDSDFFSNDYQTAFLVGTGYPQQVVDPLVHFYSDQDLLEHFKRIRSKIQTLLKSLPIHDEYLEIYINKPALNRR